MTATERRRRRKRETESGLRSERLQWRNLRGKWKECDGEPVRARGIMDWAYWFEYAQRNLARTSVEDAMVSTVFLGIDHGWGVARRPILYESMIFADHDPQIDNDMRRYSTREEALAGHRLLVEMLEHRYGAKGIEKIPMEVEYEQAQARNRERRQARRKARSRSKNLARLRSRGA